MSFYDSIFKDNTLLKSIKKNQAKNIKQFKSSKALNMGALQTAANYSYMYPNGAQTTGGTSPNTVPVPGNGPWQTTTTSSTFPDSEWPKEAKKALAKVGFVYDPEKNVWKLSLTATVELPQLTGIMALGYGMHGKPTMDSAIAAIKECKKNLIKKLTAKIVLSELVRPRTINE